MQENFQWHLVHFSSVPISLIRWLHTCRHPSALELTTLTRLQPEVPVAVTYLGKTVLKPAGLQVTDLNRSLLSVLNRLVFI